MIEEWFNTAITLFNRWKGSVKRLFLINNIWKLAKDKGLINQEYLKYWIMKGKVCDLVDILYYYKNNENCRKIGVGIGFFEVRNKYGKFMVKLPKISRRNLAGRVNFLINLLGCVRDIIVGRIL
jgi:hypothetical protein